MVFLPAIRAAHPQAEGSESIPAGSALSSDHNISGSASGPKPINAVSGPGPTSLASARFSATMQPPPAPVIRKQNIACDACRTKKVRCQRMTIEQICQGRGSECTSNYVLQLAESKAQKRVGGKRRRKSENEDEGTDQVVGALDSARVHPPPLEREYSSSSARASPQPAKGEVSRRSTSVQSQSQSQSQSRSRSQSQSHPSSLRTSRLASDRQHDLLRYLFAPEAITHSHFDYNDISDIRNCDAGESDLWEEMGGRVWEEPASAAHLGLPDDHLHDLADELLDSFFSIAHIRYPLLDIEQVRAQFTDPDTHPSGPIYHPLLAVALAFGARFSENPTLLADREEISARDRDTKIKGPTRSRVVQLLVIRAREVAEVCKVFRYAKMDNVQVGILLEALLAQAPFLRDRYEPSLVQYASRHLSALGLNTPSGLLAVKDGRKKSEAIFAWWMLSLSDGFRAAFYRLQPALYDGDLGVDLHHHLFSTLWDQGAKSDVPFGHQDTAQTSSHGQERDNSIADLPPTGPHNQAWFTASNAGSAMCRNLCHQLWTPKVKEYGIPLSVLIEFANLNTSWRDEHLSKLGVPSKWPDHWDFLAAITACSTDVYYHCLWLVVMKAINEFGIMESRASSGQVDAEIQSVVDRYRTEADHGAMRIAALAAVLTENGYLRLDPSVIYHPIYETGLYLAKQGKEECLICVAGLKQYSIPFPSVWSLAEEIESIYSDAVRRGPSPSNAIVGTNGAPANIPNPPIQAQVGPALDVQNISWTSSANPLSQNGNGHGQGSMPMPTGVPNPIIGAGNGKDLWPDGTPVPSRDVAWTLFDWLHQM